jgi:mRNA-degrading endonuclease YafQ of YafQ-DinJ toxin-antitoxin module
MVKKIEAYQFSHKFKKEFKALPKEIQKSFEEILSLLLINSLHPSLRIKNIQGSRDCREGSITQNYRFTFYFSESNSIIFRRIGTHEILRALTSREKPKT